MLCNTVHHANTVEGNDILCRALERALSAHAESDGLSLKLDGLYSGLWEGGWLARCLALGTAFAFALYLLATRGAQPQDLDAALVAVGLAWAGECVCSRCKATSTWRGG